MTITQSQTRTVKRSDWKTQLFVLGHFLVHNACQSCWRHRGQIVWYTRGFHEPNAYLRDSSLFCSNTEICDSRKLALTFIPKQSAVIDRTWCQRCPLDFLPIPHTGRSLNPVLLFFNASAQRQSSRIIKRQLGWPNPGLSKHNPP